MPNYFDSHFTLHIDIRLIYVRFGLSESKWTNRSILHSCIDKSAYTVNSNPKQATILHLCRTGPKWRDFDFVSEWDPSKCILQCRSMTNSEKQ